MSELVAIISHEVTLNLKLRVLLGYLDNLVKNSKFAKKENFYYTINAVIDCLFSNSYGLILHLSRDCTFNDYDLFFYSLNPLEDSPNLFHLLHSPIENINYDILVDIEKISPLLSKLVKMNEREIAGFIIGSLMNRDNSNLINSGKLKLNCFELYLVILLKYITTTSNCINQDLLKVNSNFKSSNIDKKDYISDYSETLRSQLDSSKSVEYNFLLNLTKAMMDYLISSNSKYLGCFTGFMLLFFVYEPFYKSSSGILNLKEMNISILPNESVYLLLNYYLIKITNHYFIKNKNEILFNFNNPIYIVLQSSLFYFFRNSFNSYVYYYLNKTVDIDVICDLYLSYIKPWMHIDAYNDNLDSLIEMKCFKNYVEINIPYYIIIFHDYIGSLAKTKHIINAENIIDSLIENFTEFEKREEEFIICKHIPLSFIYEISIGKANNNISRVVYSQLSDLNINIKYIYPFNFHENKEIVMEYVNKYLFYNVINDKDQINQSKNLKVLTKLSKIYAFEFNSIRSNGNMKELKFSSSNKFHRINNLYSPWKKNLSSGEFQFLYNIFYNLSIKIDRLNGIQSDVPKTNLRMFASIYNVLPVLIILYLFYCFLSFSYSIRKFRN